MVKPYCFSIITAITLYFFLIFMDRFLTCIIYHATVSCFRIGVQFLFYCCSMRIVPSKAW